METTKNLCPTSSGVLRIACHLILGGITDESFSVCKGHIRWSGSVALVVGNNLHSIILPHTDATFLEEHAKTSENM